MEYACAKFASPFAAGLCDGSHGQVHVPRFYSVLRIPIIFDYLTYWIALVRSSLAYQNFLIFTEPKVLIVFTDHQWIPESESAS